MDDIEENKVTDSNGNVVVESLIEKIKPLTIDQQRYLLYRLEDLMFAEKRKYKRIKCNFEIDLNVEGKLYKNIIKDISQGGAFIETEAPIEVGKQVTLNVNDRSSRSQMQIRCMVVRQTQLGAGVSFIGDSKQQKMKLKTFLKSLSEK